LFLPNLTTTTLYINNYFVRVKWHSSNNAPSIFPPDLSASGGGGPLGLNFLYKKILESRF